MTHYEITIVREWIASSNREWMWYIKDTGRGRGGLTPSGALASVFMTLVVRPGDTFAVTVCPDTTDEIISGSNPHGEGSI